MKTLKLLPVLFLLLTATLVHAQCCTKIYTAGKGKPSRSSVISECKKAGAVLFMPADKYERYIENKWEYGVPCDGGNYFQFVVPFSQLDAIKEKVWNDSYAAGVYTTSGIMELLGTENWSGQVVYVVVPAKKLDKLAIRAPRKGDCGTNDKFVAGGCTSGGCCEGYISQKFSCPDCAVYSLNTGRKLH